MAGAKLDIQTLLLLVEAQEPISEASPLTTGKSPAAARTCP
jgi:hypothetical protein